MPAIWSKTPRESPAMPAPTMMTFGRCVSTYWGPMALGRASSVVSLTGAGSQFTRTRKGVAMFVLCTYVVVKGSDCDMVENIWMCMTQRRRWRRDNAEVKEGRVVFSIMVNVGQAKEINKKNGGGMTKSEWAKKRQKRKSRRKWEKWEWGKKHASKWMFPRVVILWAVIWHVWMCDRGACGGIDIVGEIARKGRQGDFSVNWNANIGCICLVIDECASFKVATLDASLLERKSMTRQEKLRTDTHWMMGEKNFNQSHFSGTTVTKHGSTQSSLTICSRSEEIEWETEKEEW